MKLLSNKDINKMSKDERKELLNELQDKACNTDYILQPIESDFVQKNINKLESKIIYNEF
jgi:hypothetical protein